MGMGAVYWDPMAHATQDQSPPAMPMAYGGDYSNPFSALSSGSLAAKFAPKTAPQAMGEMNSASGMLPRDLQLASAGVTPQRIAQERKRYMNDVAAPAEAKLLTDQIAMGRDNSTFGGAEMAQMKAENLRQSQYAAEDMVDRALARWKAKRDSYFGGEGGLVTPDQGYAQYGSWLNQAMMTQLAQQKHQMEMDQYGREKFGDMWGAIASAGAGGVSMLGPYLPGLFKGAFNFVKKIPVPTFGGGAGAPVQATSGYSPMAYGAGSKPFGPASFYQGPWT